jgi:hypothetical protein
LKTEERGRNVVIEEEEEEEEEEEDSMNVPEDCTLITGNQKIFSV